MPQAQPSEVHREHILRHRLQTHVPPRQSIAEPQRHPQDTDLPRPAHLPLQLLGQLVNIGTLLAFVLVCIGVIILRRTRPDLDRPFKTPWVPFVPIMGIVCCFGLMLTLPEDTWIRLIAWLIIGLVIYFGYGRRHSRLQKELAEGKAAA